MRNIELKQICKAIKNLCYKANFSLPSDVVKKFREIYKEEKNKLTKKFINILIENSKISKYKKIPLCQDTGIPFIFLDIGNEVKITGLKGYSLTQAINQSVKDAYKEYYLRQSLINDPLLRENVRLTEPVVHYEFFKGKTIKIGLLIRGAGCENVTCLRMFSPSATLFEIKEFIVETVKQKLNYSCPPVTVGVGIGGDSTTAVLLSKKCFLRKFGVINKNNFYTKFEQDIFKEIRNSKTNIFGFNNKKDNSKILNVFIEHKSCHIASLPVAVSLQCNSYRRCNCII